MRALLPALAVLTAAAVLPTGSAAAQISGQIGSGGVSFSSGDAAQSSAGRHDGRRGWDRDRRHRRAAGPILVGDFGWNDAWALYNNRSFQPDSYNDWWHDRPDRAYPRWMQNNADCSRMWWGGGGWRC